MCAFAVKVVFGEAFVILGHRTRGFYLGIIPRFMPGKGKVEWRRPGFFFLVVIYFHVFFSQNSVSATLLASAFHSDCLVLRLSFSSTSKGCGAEFQRLKLWRRALEARLAVDSTIASRPR